VATGEKGNKTTKVGDNGMVMERVRPECQVEMTEEDTMMVIVAHQVTLNKEGMEEVKVESTVELHIAVKVVEEIGVAKAKALVEITDMAEKGTAVKTTENKIYEMVDVAIKMITKEGIQRCIIMKIIFKSQNSKFIYFLCCQPKCNGSVYEYFDISALKRSSNTSNVLRLHEVVMSD